MKLDYVLRRVAALFLTILFVSLVTFLAFEIIPGDPVTTMLGADADPALVEKLRSELGTDLPPHLRLFRWAAGVALGDLGSSLRYSLPVSTLILDRAAISLMIAAYSLLIVVGIAIPLGIYLALNRTHWSEPILSASIQIGMSVPSFWLGIMLISVFGLLLNLFPTGGFVDPQDGLFESLRSITLPAIAIAIPQIAVVVRYVRNSILDQLNQDYVRTARSKGLPASRVVRQHVLRNAALPVVTVLGMIFADVVAGTIVIEQVFALPGLGLLLVNSVSARDFPLIQGLILYITFTVAFFNLLVDLAYQAIDPRIEIS